MSFGGGGSEVTIPAFQEDPYYKKTQDYLFPYGTNILEGNVNDYYKGIGETGGKAFEDMMGLINRDTMAGVNENLTRRGISRSGLGVVATGKAMADAGTKMRWQDYTRALEGKKFLMGAGTDMLSGVRSGALSNQQMTNQYGLNRAQLQMEQEKQNQEGGWGDVLSSILGAAGTVGGMLFGGSMADQTSKASNFLGDLGNSNFSMKPLIGSAAGSKTDINDLLGGSNYFGGVRFGDYM